MSICGIRFQAVRAKAYGPKLSIRDSTYDVSSGYPDEFPHGSIGVFLVLEDLDASYDIEAVVAKGELG